MVKVSPLQATELWESFQYGEEINSKSPLTDCRLWLQYPGTAGDRVSLYCHGFEIDPLGARAYEPGKFGGFLICSSLAIWEFILVIVLRLCSRVDEGPPVAVVNRLKTKLFIWLATSEQLCSCFPAKQSN
jgi:hypothetical protein